MIKKSTNLVGVLDIDDLLALSDVAGNTHAEGYPNLLAAGLLHCFLELGVLGDVEQLGHEVAVLESTLGQEQTAAIGMRQQAHVHEDLVAEDVDVQLIRHISDQLHEQFALAHAVQLLPAAQQCA